MSRQAVINGLWGLSASSGPLSLILNGTEILKRVQGKTAVDWQKVTACWGSCCSVLCSADCAFYVPAASTLRRWSWWETSQLGKPAWSAGEKRTSASLRRPCDWLQMYEWMNFHSLVLWGFVRACLRRTTKQPSGWTLRWSVSRCSAFPSVCSCKYVAHTKSLSRFVVRLTITSLSDHQMCENHTMGSFFKLLQHLLDFIDVLWFF